MKYTLWIMQVILAVMFMGAGVSGLITPYDTLVATAGMGWAEMFPPIFIKIISILEILGAVGVILPSLTGIYPMLTPLAAQGLFFIMVGAFGTHVIRGEWSSLFQPLLLALMAVAVTYGRWKLLPVPPRGRS